MAAEAAAEQLLERARSAARSRSSRSMPRCAASQIALHRPHRAAASGQLLHQHARDLRSSSAASSTRVGSCSEEAKYASSDSASESPVERHDALVAHAALLRLNRHGERARRCRPGCGRSACTDRPSAASAAPASKRATARSRKSCVHWATSRFTAPLPCSCSVSVPRNLSVAASSTDGRHGLAEQLAHRRRVILVGAQLAPRVAPGAPSGRAPAASRR